MRLFFLTSLVMVAFAANSVLNRLALVGTGTDPAAFALLRLAAGGVVLVALVMMRTGKVPWRGHGRMWGVLSLALYVIGFSFAYVTLDAGTGALILFGGVQITMFVGAVLLKESIPITRWLGVGIAFGGLFILLAPKSGQVPDLTGVLLMAAAAIGWGVYSLLGRGARDPLGATAANFALAVPIGAACFLLAAKGMTPFGAVLAIVSGALTSGVGYAAWYSVLPRIDSSLAGVAQLTVPVIAAAGGLVFLGEPLTLRFMISAILVLGGVLVSLRRATE
ncbi:MAG: DMT family transporter [Marinosulfonomonas sp.]